jgi:hypothetical protein
LSTLGNGEFFVSQIPDTNHVHESRAAPLPQQLWEDKRDGAEPINLRQRHRLDAVYGRPIVLWTRLFGGIFDDLPRGLWLAVTVMPFVAAVLEPEIVNS